jgi:hypothetical protein
MTTHPDPVAPHLLAREVRRLLRITKVGDGEVYDSLSNQAAMWLALLCEEPQQKIQDAGSPDGVEALPFSDVVVAIRAATSENSRRGEMFPQTADEHREDRIAAQRTIETIEFLGKQCEQLPNWPALKRSAPVAVAQEPVAWRHRLVDPDGNVDLDVCDGSDRSRFGIPGIDYGAGFVENITPLSVAPAERASRSDGGAAVPACSNPNYIAATLAEADRRYGWKDHEGWRVFVTLAIGPFGVVTPEDIAMATADLGLCTAPPTASAHGGPPMTLRECMEAEEGPRDGETK